MQAAGQDGESSVSAAGIVGPSTEQPLSRQVFIVQELEIRDRLASSQINKFLYLYTSESMPRRAHSNMVRQQKGRAQAEGSSSVWNWLCFLFVADSEGPAGLPGVWPRGPRVLSADQPATTTT